MKRDGQKGLILEARRIRREEGGVISGSQVDDDVRGCERDIRLDEERGAGGAVGVVCKNGLMTG